MALEGPDPVSTHHMSSTSTDTMTEHPTNDLVLANLPLVGYNVRSLTPRLPQHVDRADLTSAGYVALVQAARSYNPSTGVPFHRYATLRIRGALLDELRRLDWVPRMVRTRAKTMVQVQDQLASQFGRRPTREEVIEVMGVSGAELDDAQAAIQRRVLSLDFLMADECADGAPNPEARNLAREQTAHLHAGVQMLPDNLRLVVEGTFFLDRSDEDLAAALGGVTRSRISQMRSEALSLLREGMHSALSPDLLPESPPDGPRNRRRQAYVASLAAQAAMNAQRPYAPYAAAIPAQRGPVDLAA